MSIRRRSDNVPTGPNTRPGIRGRQCFPLEDRLVFAYLTTFLDPVDLVQLWSCSRGIHTFVVPNLVPRVQWGPEVFTWPEHSIMRRYVLRMRTWHTPSGTSAFQRILEADDDEDEADDDKDEADDDEDEADDDEDEANDDHDDFDDAIQRILDADDGEVKPAAFSGPLSQGMLPINLERLFLGDEFSDHALAVDVLPRHLAHLSFGRHYNHPLVTGVLPASLTNLRFGREFKKNSIMLSSDPSTRPVRHSAF